MRNLIFTLSFVVALITNADAQGLGNLIKKATTKDTSGKSITDKLFNKSSSSGIGNNLSNDDIISGLREALRVGTDSSSKKLSKLDGFFGDAAIKILMPAEAQKVEKTLRGVGMAS